VRRTGTNQKSNTATALLIRPNRVARLAGCNGEFFWSWDVSQPAQPLPEKYLAVGRAVWHRAIAPDWLVYAPGWAILVVSPCHRSASCPQSALRPPLSCVTGRLSAPGRRRGDHDKSTPRQCMPARESLCTESFCSKETAVERRPTRVRPPAPPHDSFFPSSPEKRGPITFAFGTRCIFRRGSELSRPSVVDFSLGLLSFSWEADLGP